MVKAQCLVSYEDYSRSFESRHWMAKMSNKEILDKVHNPEPLEAKMRRLRLRFFEQCMRKDSSLEKDLMAGIASGSRRGRQRKRWMDCILADAGISLAEAVALCKNRDSQRQLIHRITRSWR